MKLKRSRLVALVPALVLGLGATLVLSARHARREGDGHAWLSRDPAAGVEAWWYDVKMKFRPARADAPVTVAALDDASVERFGRWPWNRGVFAELVDVLYEAGARSVVFDLVFSEPEYKSQELERTLRIDVPGRQGSLQKMLRLNEAQVKELATLLPDIGDQYLGQSVWAHAPQTVLGYFWRTPAECRVLRSSEVSSDAALALGRLPEAQWLDHLEAITKHGYRLDEAESFTEASFGPASLGPRQWCATINRGAVGALAQRQGFFNAEADADGVFRRSATLLPLWLPKAALPASRTSLAGLYAFPSLALSAAMTEFRATVVAPEWRDYGKLQIAALTLPTGVTGGARLPLQSDGSFWIDFAPRGDSGAEIVPTVSLARAGYWSDEEKSRIRDKVIMIGPTSTGVFDLRPNPVNPQGAGVYLHAAAASQIIEMARPASAYRGLVSVSHAGQLAALWIFLVALGLSVLYSRRALVTSAWWVAILAGAVVDFVAFRAGWVSDFVLIALAWSLALGAITLLLYLLEERERIYLKNAFARYVSPEIVRRIEENPSELNLDGERKEISVLFSDIRGFTAVSEVLQPDDLRALLNAYFKPMTEAIQRAGGTVDKFIGDAIMALFGAPLALDSHASASVRAAEAMVMALDRLRAEDPRFAKFPLESGIAVASGTASVGNMGTDKIFNYTALGDVVNVASRLEGLTKIYGVPLLISESTLAQLSADDRPRWRLVDRVRVAGKSTPVQIYDLPELSAPAASALAEAYARAFGRYVAGEWGEAKRAFAELASHDPASRHMARRCELAPQALGAADWDGVWNFDHK